MGELTSPTSIQGCFSKRRYSTEEFALRVARRAEAKRGTHLRAYYCQTCCGWHLSKVPLEDWLKRQKEKQS